MSTNTETQPTEQAEISTLDVVEQMTRRGGSFIAHLALAALRADEINLAKIKATWPAEWAKYEAFARSAR